MWSGKTTMCDLRKLIEETRKGTTNMRSRMFEDMIYYFNDAPNIHGKPEARRRKYVFGIVPARQKDYDDSKVQTMQPVVVAADAERELFADQLLTRYNEKLTVLVIQGPGLGTAEAKSHWAFIVSTLHPGFFAEFWIGPGCGEVCAYRECLKCAEWWERTHGAVSATSERSVPSTVK
jgi:hypothetical protein